MRREIHNPLLTASLQDFKDVLDCLQSIHSEGEQQYLLQLLEDTSREIAFQLGRPSTSSADLLRTIDNLFGDAIVILKHTTNDRAQTIAQNIAERAKQLFTD